MVDMVNEPPHYRRHPSGVETIRVAEQLPHLLATAFAYVERSPYKGTEVEDLEKARWYIERHFLTRGCGTGDDLVNYMRQEPPGSVGYLLAMYKISPVHVTAATLLERLGDRILIAQAK